MARNLDLIDRTTEDLRVLDIAVEGATVLIAEHVNDSLATGLVVAFTRLKNDVEEMIEES